MTKTKEEFLKDIETIYDISSKKTAETAKYLDFKDDERRKFLEKFLNDNAIRICDESIYAAAVRLVNLKRDALVQFLKNENIDEKTIDEIVSRAYEWVRGYREQIQEEMLGKIESEELLTPFYRELISNSHEVGKVFNQWLPKWKAHIINGVNRELKSQFEDDEKVFEFLRSHELMDIGHFDEEADRSYSALVMENDNYVAKAYIDVFDDVEKIVDRLLEFKTNLMKFHDEVFELDDEYQKYLQALIDAFSETDRNKLVDKWCKVDEAWMGITAPIQISHPLEYYDDHYRKAVQLEWDVRLINPRFAKNTRSVEIKKTYEQMFAKVGEGYDKVFDMCNANIDRTQLYIGKPFLYYGSELEGLFSAQVVPNDMVASEKFGKKIFANADFILETSRNRPFMKLPKMIFEEDHIRKAREFLFNETEKWHRLYDIETIGHEYGHILWLDSDTEVHMNVGGNFKNIEEFKATTGGLVSYFLNEESDLKEEFVRDLVQRGVGLIAWMKVGEVLPYYCEGLIHLKGLFDSEVISWESSEKIKVTINDETYDKLRTWYIETYSKLASTYLKKQNADEFLFDYAKREGDVFLPVDEHIEEFVKHVYDLYEKHGNEVDHDDKKENYLIVD